MARMRFSDVLAAEFRKARTLPSLVITVGVSCVLVVLYGLASAPGAARMLIERPAQAVEGLTAPMMGMHLLGNLEFVPVVSAVLIVASEYAGGQLTTSALAAPRRSWFVLAKLTVVVCVVLTQAVFASLMVSVFFQGALGEHSVFVAGGLEEHVRRLALGSLHWVLLGVMSASVALIVRSQTIVMAVFVLLPAPAFFLVVLSKHFQYLPTVAGMLMFGPEYLNDLTDPPDLDFLRASVVTVFWGVGAAITALVIASRRDIGARQMTSE